MKKTILSVLTTSFLCFGSCCIATAQAPVAQSDQITDDGSQQTIQDDGSTTGKFEPVTVDPSASSDVAIAVPPEHGQQVQYRLRRLMAGRCASGSTAIGADGSLSFSFQVTDQPGVHRVLVIDPSDDQRLRKCNSKCRVQQSRRTTA